VALLAADRLAVGPGLGMARVGMGGEAAIVMLLVAFTFVGGLAIVAAGEPLGILLVIAGVGLWAAAARDAFVVAGTGRDEAWLKPRVLTVIAIFIMLATAVALLRSLPGARGT
jgi:hypothetical protein